MTGSDLTILTTGAGAPGARSIFKALRAGCRAESRNLRLITCDMDNEAYGFHLSDKNYIVPAGGDPSFIDTILEICRIEKPDLLFSWVDPELLNLANHKHRIEKLGTKVVISEPNVIENCINKSRSYEIASGLGLTPNFVIVEDQKDFEKAVQNLGYPQKPVCFKPIHGHGGRGFRILQPNANRAELLFTEKPNSTITSLEDVLNVFSDIHLPNLMVMEYLPGKEYTVDMLIYNGEPIVTIPRERARVKLGISNIAKLERNEQVISAAEAVARALGLNYNANIQFKLDGKANPKLIEVQPRLAGTTAAVIGAGANLPWLAAKLALGESLPQMDIKWDTVMKRFLEEVYTDGSYSWFL